MDLSTGLISIAMCTYNGERYLDAQLQSILDQTYPNLEIVVCDDCSTDNTWTILKGWQERHPHIIRIYRNIRNIGYNQNFEQAIRYCKGDLIAISDQDDIWLPEKLRKQAAVLAASPKTLLVHCASLNFTEDRFFHRKGQLRWNYLYKGHDCRTFLIHNHVQGHCILFRKTLTEEITPIPPDVYYDWWIAAVATFCGEIDAVAEYLVYHRLHQQNAYYTPNNLRRPNTKINQLLLRRMCQHTRCPRPMRDFLGNVDSLLTTGKQEERLGYDMSLFRHAWKHKMVYFGHKKRNNRLSLTWSLFKSCLKMAKN